MAYLSLVYQSSKQKKPPETCPSATHSRARTTQTVLIDDIHQLRPRQHKHLSTKNTARSPMKQEKRRNCACDYKASMISHFPTCTTAFVLVTLTCLEPWFLFVYHIHTSFSSNHFAVPVSAFCGLQRPHDFHDSSPTL